MHDLILEHFRGFDDLIQIPIAPLTLLVGENSSGKSSFLAAFRLAWDLSEGNALIDFNERPFNLGSFEQIITSVGGSARRPSSFHIGAEFQGSSSPGVRIVGEFVRARSQPVLGAVDVSILSDGTSIRLEYDDGEPSRALIRPRPKSAPIELSLDREEFLPDRLRLDWQFLLIPELLGTRKRTVAESLRRIRMAVFNRRGTERPIALAPVRTQPQRTYDPVNQPATPEGQHIPMLLATRLAEATSRQSAELKEQLEEFGSAAGLFREIKVRELGRGGDPFQILVRPAGSWRNLIDVGYGVSQALPILVATLEAEPDQTVLIQQPEVHLHPRAQAEFGSLAGAIVKDRRINLMIETHSDYLVDRIRMDIRDKRSITASDVSILYFEQRGPRTVVQHVRLDEMGNIVKPPPGYRSFFMREDARFFNS